MAEMVVMDVMVCQALEGFQDKMDVMGRGDQQDLLEHRGHLDPGVGEPLTSGGAEPLAQTQRELN